MPATTLQLAVRDALGARVREAPLASVPARFDTGAWDDAAALAALNGEQAHVDALRKLFLDELPDTRDGVRDAARAGDVERLRAALQDRKSTRLNSSH